MRALITALAFPLHLPTRPTVLPCRQSINFIRGKYDSCWIEIMTERERERERDN